MVRAVRKFIWILRITKHRLMLLAKFVIKRTLLIIYEKTGLKKIYQRITFIRLLEQAYDYRLIAQPKRPVTIALIFSEGTTYPKSSAFVRLISPLSKLMREDRVSYKLYGHNTTKLPADTDACIVQRTAYNNMRSAEKLVSNLKERGIKLIVDNDDAFSHIDNSHSEYSTLNGRHSVLEYLIENADDVWVSTAPLASQIRKVNPSVHVLANTLDERLWRQDMYKQSLRGKLRMVYMGTASHDEDFKMLLAALDELAKKFPKTFKLSIIGISLNELPKRRWITRLYQPRGWAIYPKFVKWFMDQGPFDIGLCPLVESPFNSYKSDIKCLDYIAANIMPVASDVPAYDTKGLDDYVIRIKNTQEQWVDKLGRILKDIEGFRKKSAKTLPKAQTYLWSERSTDIAAQTMLDRFKALKLGPLD